MNFTEFKMDADAIRERLSEMKSNLRRNKGTEDLLGFGAGVVAARLNRNPAEYLTYGPYWWSLKGVLRRQGRDYGSSGALELEGAYKGESDELTLVMAETFRELYQEMFMQGTRTFTLDGEEGEDWTLMDPDMEQRIQATTLF